MYTTSCLNSWDIRPAITITIGKKKTKPKNYYLNIHKVQKHHYWVKIFENTVIIITNLTLFLP